MLLSTWNINGLRARLAFILAWLEERRPDLVGLQELKVTDDLFPHEEFEAAGYRALAHGQKSWNGVAILGRLDSVGAKLELLQEGLPGQEDFGARLISAQVQELVFTTVYCPNGKSLDHADFNRKLAWFDALREHFASRYEPEQAHVLCGDFNICPTGLDSWNEAGKKGHIFHTDVERQRFAALCDWGLDDLFRVLHPDAQEFSWWDYRGGSFHRGHGLRIDFVLGTAAVREQLQTAVIDRNWRKKQGELTASDHAPVVVELETT